MESVALEFFEAHTGKIVDQVGFVSRDDNPYIASSPDGLIKNGNKYTEAVEVKCPSTAVYLEGWLEDKIPKDYEPQAIQYFIVNDDLEKLYFITFDPRVTIHPMHIIEMHRSEVEQKIAEYKLLQEVMLAKVESTLNELIQI